MAAETTRQRVIRSTDENVRQQYEQYLTPKETASLAVSMFSEIGLNPLKCLDLGAGTGILSTALFARYGKAVDIFAVELDGVLAKICDNELNSHGVSHQVYVGDALTKSFNIQFDRVILNPPYKKIGKDAPEAAAMPDVCYGAPNLYFLFASMSLFNLKYDGEMVYIIPRSWTSGAYFRKFRQKFLKEASLEHIHLFISRDKVFEKENVLQETIIIKVKKTSLPSHEIVMTTSKSNHDFNDKTIFKVPYTTVVHGKEDYVYLVTNEKDVATLNVLHKWNQTLPDIGLKMKTGLTVDFRNRDA